MSSSDNRTLTGSPESRPVEDDQYRPAPSDRRVRRHGAPGDTGRSRRSAGTSAVVYFSVAGVLGVLAVAVAVVVFTTGVLNGHKAADTIVIPAGNGLLPTDYSSAPSSPVFAPIDARTADPRPLNADTLFGTRTLTDPDTHLTLTLGASQLTSQCARAVWGSGLTGVLGKAGCSQAARAVYVDKAGSCAAFVTIFNLGTADGANRLVAALDPSGGTGGFITPPTGTPAAFGKGVGVARGLAMGHYAVVSWVQRLTGPTTGTASEQDPALMSLLITSGKPDAVLSRVVAADPSAGPAPKPSAVSKTPKKK